MLDVVRNWVITICCTLFFITAVEMILPNNSMKKYAKFVLGLILITVIINPIIKIFNGDFNTAVYTSNLVNSMDDNSMKAATQRYKDENINSTLINFKENLKLSCEKSLKEKFPNNKFQVTIDASFDKKSELFKLKSIDVRTKISIKEQVILFLSDELKINKELVNVFNQ
ncbi:MAG: stage III sporulation protein AF [Clostridiaceae bacterium]|nr:stage III sporulation protein AF [Clostridiaceae bacterium]